jgi:hypothetical protein
MKQVVDYRHIHILDLQVVQTQCELSASQVVKWDLGTCLKYNVRCVKNISLYVCGCRILRLVSFVNIFALMDNCHMKRNLPME